MSAIMKGRFRWISVFGLTCQLVMAVDVDRCHLFTDAFGRLLQLSLGCIAVFMLYIKRKLEFPIRPIKVRPMVAMFCSESQHTRSHARQVWALDVSKQSLGALYIHCISVVLSIVMVSTSSGDFDEVPPSNTKSISETQYRGSSLDVHNIAVAHLMFTCWNSAGSTLSTTSSTRRGAASS
jgi:hypothetical protein